MDLRARWLSMEQPRGRTTKNQRVMYGILSLPVHLAPKEVGRSQTLTRKHDTFVTDALHLLLSALIDITVYNINYLVITTGE